MVPNATNATYQKGLADYFSPMIAISRVSAGVSIMFVVVNLFSDPTLANSGSGLFKEQLVESDAGISVQN
jgi:chemotaxis protein MotB